jgi:hypothetical protein
VPKPGFSFLLDSSHPFDFTIQWLPFLFLSKESNQTSTSYLKKKKKKRKEKKWPRRSICTTTDLESCLTDRSLLVSVVADGIKSVHVSEPLFFKSLL